MINPIEVHVGHDGIVDKINEIIQHLNKQIIKDESLNEVIKQVILGKSKERLSDEN